MVEDVAVRRPSATGCRWHCVFNTGNSNRITATIPVNDGKVHEWVLVNYDATGYAYLDDVLVGTTTTTRTIVTGKNIDIGAGAPVHETANLKGADRLNTVRRVCSSVTLEPDLVAGLACRRSLPNPVLSQA